MRQAMLRALCHSAGAAHKRSLLPQAQALRSQPQQRRQIFCRQLHASACVRRPAAPATASADVHAPQHGSDGAAAIVLAKLDECIAQRQPMQALTLFQQLSEPPSTLTMQKLAILLAKQKDAVLVARAYEILQSVYRYVRYDCVVSTATGTNVSFAALQCFTG